MSQNSDSNKKNSTQKSTASSWFIVKHASEQCKIFSGESPGIDTEIKQSNSVASTSVAPEDNEQSCNTPSKENPGSEEEIIQQWGPFETRGQAIAKRVGLIRAGKCRPVGDIVDR